MERTATKSVGPFRNTIFEKALGPRPTKSFPARPKIVLNRISDHKHFFSQTSNTILRGVLAFLYKKMPLGFSHCFIQLFVHRGTLEKSRKNDASKSWPYELWSMPMREGATGILEVSGLAWVFSRVLRDSISHYVCLSLCPPVWLSVNSLFGVYWRFSHHCPCPNTYMALLITAPAHLHATKAAVYTALFL